MNVEYQIFVSLTYENLKDECSEDIKARLNVGHVPVDTRLSQRPMALERSAMGRKAAI